MANLSKFARIVACAMLLSAFPAVFASAASAQSFTLTVLTPLSPPGVDPGGSATATLDLEPVGNFNGSVSFSATLCTVTPVQTTGTPVCMVSPDSAIPPAKPSVTVTTTGATPAGLYSVTVTGSSGSLSQVVNLTFSVVDVTQNYTISASPTTATPSPIAAGSSATTTITVTPIASYTGNVTLACLAVSPATALAPVCSFNPATVQVGGGVPPTSTLTISTTGPAARLLDGRILYALWMVFPAIVLLGSGCGVAWRKSARGKTRRNRFVTTFLLLLVAASLGGLPACNATKRTGGSTSSVTPANTYSFTLTGADQNGVGSSSTSAATVTLTVK